VRVGHKTTPTSREERVAFAVRAAACFAGIDSVQQLVKQSPAGRSEHDRAAASGRSGSGHRHVGMTDTAEDPVTMKTGHLACCGRAMLILG
jgi:hypothetical protein